MCVCVTCGCDVKVKEREQIKGHSNNNFMGFLSTTCLNQCKVILHMREYSFIIVSVLVYPEGSKILFDVSSSFFVIAVGKNLGLMIHKNSKKIFFLKGIPFVTFSVICLFIIPVHLFYRRFLNKIRFKVICGIRKYILEVFLAVYRKRIKEKLFERCS